MHYEKNGRKALKSILDIEKYFFCFIIVNDDWQLFFFFSYLPSTSKIVVRN